MLYVFYESFELELFENLINGQFIPMNLFTVDLCDELKNKIIEKKRSSRKIMNKFEVKKIRGKLPNHPKNLLNKYSMIEIIYI